MVTRQGREIMKLGEERRLRESTYIERGRLREGSEARVAWESIEDEKEGEIGSEGKRRGGISISTTPNTRRGPIFHCS